MQKQCYNITFSTISIDFARKFRERPVRLLIALSIAILAGLAYLASNYIYHIGPLFRQHISMVMFETLAILGRDRSLARIDRTLSLA